MGASETRTMMKLLLVLVGYEVRVATRVFERAYCAVASERPCLRLACICMIFYIR